MSMKTVVANVAANKKDIIKKTLIVAGSVVGLALTAGLIAGKVAHDGSFEPADVELPNSDA